MGCKVQSIWHIWTLLLLPFVKLQHFFTQLCRNTDHNVWNVLILSELFNNLLFYILHILHFLLQNSLCSCLFPPNLRGFCSSPGPRRTGMEVPAPSSSHPAPRGCCRSVRHPWGRGGRATGLRGHGQDTSQLLSSWHSQESDVTLPRRWIHLLRYRHQIALRFNSQAESSPWALGAFFPQQGENTSACIKKATPNYHVNTGCWSGYFSFVVGQKE